MTVGRSDAFTAFRQRSTLKLADVFDGFGQLTGELTDAEFQIASQFAGVGDDREVEGARGEPADWFVTGAFRLEFLEEGKIQVEDGGTAGIDQTGVEFAETADYPALPPEFGAACRVFPGIGFAL